MKPDHAYGGRDGSSAVYLHRVSISTAFREATALSLTQCNASTHGDELLATFDGTDTKFSCSIVGGLFSWMSPSESGGYLGSDVGSFLASVKSGLPGAYVLNFWQSQNIGENLTVQAGQSIAINGESVTWGTGGFVVGQRGSLALTDLRLSGAISFIRGARALTLRHNVLAESVLHRMIVPSGCAMTLETPLGSNYSLQHFAIKAGASFSIVGPAQLHDGFSLLALAVTSMGNVSISGGLVGMYGAQNTPNAQQELLATVRGELPGVLHLQLTHAGQLLTQSDSPDLSGTITQATNGRITAHPPDWLTSTGWTGVWSSGSNTNAAGKPYTLLRLPLAKFAGHTDFQHYVDLCVEAGARPLVTGNKKYGAPEYCASMNCLQGPAWTPGAEFAGLYRNTGWQRLVMFSPCGDSDSCFATLAGAGGIMNSIGGVEQDEGWELECHPICARENAT